jgi:hypothetical protein
MKRLKRIATLKLQISIMLICSFKTFIVNGQSGLDNLWVSGYNCCSPQFGVTFTDMSSSNLTFNVTNSKMDFTFQNALISDTAGNRLFYTNGMQVYGRNDSLMPNGDSLAPSSCNNFPIGGILGQGCLILPKPNSNSIYYLFHFGCDYSSPVLFPKALYLTEVDMSLNGGNGDVTKKNIVKENQVLTILLTGVKHANGRDWWVVTHSFEGDTFFTLLVTPVGIQGPFSQKIGCNLVYPATGIGQSWFSQNGDKFVTATNSDINLFDFDRCTGLFSNWSFLAKPDTLPFTSGCAFSPSGKYLYYSESYHLYQYDISVTNWQNTETLVATYDGFIGTCNTMFRYWALMSNGKIYGTPAGCGEQYLHVINSPDSAGTICNVQQHSVYLPTHNAGTFPNYPNYSLGKLAGSVCDTITGIAPLPNALPFWVRVFPNPATTEVIFTYTPDLFETGLLTIADNLSRKVVVRTINGKGTINVELKGFNPGIYYYKITGAEYCETGKLIVF